MLIKKVDIVVIIFRLLLYLNKATVQFDLSTCVNNEYLPR